MVFHLIPVLLQVNTVGQDISYQSSGAAVNQEDPMGSEDDEDDDPMSRPDPGCQDLDKNQVNELDLDPDLGYIPEPDFGGGELPQYQGQPESPGSSLNLD